MSYALDPDEPFVMTVGEYHKLLDRIGTLEYAPELHLEKHEGEE